MSACCYVCEACASETCFNETCPHFEYSNDPLRELCATCAGKGDQ